jgi:hypothetical protein
MTLPVGPMTLFVHKQTLESKYPGGLDGFRSEHPEHEEDDHLVSVGCGSLQSCLRAVEHAGIDPHREVAIAAAADGPLRICPGIVLERCDPSHAMGWLARAAEESAAPA